MKTTESVDQRGRISKSTTKGANAVRVLSTVPCMPNDRRCCVGASLLAAAELPGSGPAAGGAMVFTLYYQSACSVCAVGCGVVGVLLFVCE